jgi:hypothetical protein
MLLFFRPEFLIQSMSGLPEIFFTAQGYQARVVMIRVRSCTRIVASTGRRWARP